MTLASSRVIVTIAALTLLLAACGGSGDDSGALEQFADAIEDAGQGQNGSDEDLGDSLGDAMGAGGGGTIIFDGTEIPIDSAVCAVNGDLVDVGTISNGGVRVLGGTNNEANPISVQVVDGDSVQWFPQGVSGDEAEWDGRTFSSDTKTYFNNVNDETAEISFEVVCP